MEDADEDLGLHQDMEADNNSSDDCSQKLSFPLAKSVQEETPYETGFHQSTRLCLNQMREAMLHHKWQEAAEYMACYAQTLEDTKAITAQQHKESIWRISTEILFHHPNSTMEDYNLLYERMKHSGIKHYLKICLEQSFHLMLHGQIKEAKQKLTEAESWRYGKESASHEQTTKLIQAYRSLLDYIIWCDKKFELSNSTSSETVNQGMHHSFRQASVHLKEILKSPGVWDPFILSYVEMLEIYEDHEGAHKVLTDYAYDSNFPPNPNALVYLYQYLHRQKAPQKNLMAILEYLHSLVPSHELMLEYSRRLLDSGDESNTIKAFEVALEMLDFACWRGNLVVWKRLKAAIQKLQTEEDWETIISERMAPRRDWWPALHFTEFHTIKESREDPELFKVKASLTKVLCAEMTREDAVE